MSRYWRIAGSEAWLVDVPAHVVRHKCGARVTWRMRRCECGTLVPLLVRMRAAVWDGRRRIFRGRRAVTP